MWSLIVFPLCETVRTLKSMPTVLTNAEVKESSVYLRSKLVFPTAVFPMINILNMWSKSCSDELFVWILSPSVSAIVMVTKLWCKNFFYFIPFFGWQAKGFFGVLNRPRAKLLKNNKVYNNTIRLLFDIGVEGQTNKHFSFQIFQPLLCDWFVN